MLKLRYPLLLTAFTINGLLAQSPTFLYASNYDANNISAYSIDPSTGALTPVPGSPFAAGLLPDWITINPSGGLAYVTNCHGNSVSGYAISPITGALTAAPGSPFAAGNCPYGVGVDPSGRFLYLNNQLDNDLGGYAVNQQNGSLTPASGSPFPSGPRPVYNVALHPNGRFVYNPSFSAGTVSGFAIDPQTGALTPVSGSPFSVGRQTVSLAIEPLGRYLYVTPADQTVYAFNIDATTGGLTPVPGSPFAVSNVAHWMAVDPTARFLFVASQANNSVIMAFAINQTNGALSNVPGSPFPVGNYPGSPTVDPSGNFLYVGIDGRASISAFRIDPVSGSLSPVSGSPFKADGYANVVAIAAPTPATGSINVTTNLSAGTFTITGAATYNGNGTTFTQPNAPAGTYSITYGNVPNCTTPNMETKTLSSGGTISFDGSYQCFGTIVVTSTPSGASFEINGPGLTYYSGVTPLTIPRAPVGDYKITWSILLGGYQTPPQEIKTIAAGQTIRFTATYKLTLVVPPNPLTFTSIVDKAPRPPQTVQVSSSGTALQVSASASTDSGDNWLSVTPSSSTTPQLFSVSASPDKLIRGLPLGTYTGSISFSADAANSPVTLPVVLKVVLPGRLSLTPIATSIVGQTQQLTAVLTASDVDPGSPIPNKQITLTVIGANAHVDKQKTDASGFAVFSYMGLSAGVDKATATTSVDGIDLASNAASITWSSPPPPMKLAIFLPPNVDANGQPLDTQGQPWPGEITGWQRALEIAAGEIAGQEGGTQFPGDRCYFGAMQATARLAKQNSLDFQKIVNEIVGTAQSLTSFLPISAGAKILAGTNEFLIQAGTSSKPDVDTLKFLTERTVGFVLSKAAGKYYNDALDAVVSDVSDQTVSDLVNNDGLIITKPSRGNNGFDGDPTTVDVRLSYNRFSHYLIGGIHASCKLLSGPVTAFYSFGMMLDELGLRVPGTGFVCDPLVTACKPVPDFKFK